MNLNKYYYNMGMAKGLVIMALISIILGWAVCGYCHTFEMDYSGPGSEFERSHDRYQDERNRDSWERYKDDNDNNRESSPRDVERATAYERDHGV